MNKVSELKNSVTFNEEEKILLNPQMCVQLKFCVRVSG